MACKSRRGLLRPYGLTCGGGAGTRADVLLSDAAAHGQALVARVARQGRLVLRETPIGAPGEECLHCLWRLPGGGLLRVYNIYLAPGHGAEARACSCQGVRGGRDAHTSGGGGGGWQFQRRAARPAAGGPARAMGLERPAGSCLHLNNGGPLRRVSGKLANTICTHSLGLRVRHWRPPYLIRPTRRAWGRGRWRTSGTPGSPSMKRARSHSLMSSWAASTSRGKPSVFPVRFMSSGGAQRPPCNARPTRTTSTYFSHNNRLLRPSLRQRADTDGGKHPGELGDISADPRGMPRSHARLTQYLFREATLERLVASGRPKPSKLSPLRPMLRKAGSSLNKALD